MANIISVTSIELPELRHYRVRKHTYELQREGLFIAEGKRVVVRLLQSSLSTVSILTTEFVFEWLRYEVPKSLLDPLTIYCTSRELMSTLVGYDVQQPILALGKVPPDVTPTDFAVKKPDHCLLVASDRLMNPDNLGVIVRNCSAFGVNLFIAGESSASPYYRRAVRNSMGTVFKMPVCHARDLAVTLREIHDHLNFQVIGAHPTGSISLQSVEFQNRTCIVFGNEETGLSEKILTLCTQSVHIPLDPAVDSFNVANAAAIFLWEVFKQQKIEYKQPTSGGRGKS